MARPLRKYDIEADRENDHIRRIKPEIKPARPLVARSALGEVGNKLPALQAQQAIGKKTTTIVKKQTSVAVRKKPEIRQAEPENARKLERAQTLPTKAQTLPAESHSTKELSRVIDVDTSDDPLLVSVYAKDIFAYLRKLESMYTIKKNYLTDHRSTVKMRAVLINWIVEVHMNFKLVLETLHLAVAILDRYLQINKKVGRETLQLAGTTALYIASKYEEIYIPDLADFVYICDDSFSKRQILSMERDILKTLKFELGRPLSLHFLRRFSQAGQVGPEHHSLSKYLLELALLEYDLCHVAPSMQAAAATCLSIGIMNGLTDPAQAWSDALEHYSTYDYASIMPTVVKLASVLGYAETSKYQSIRTKYSEAKYDKISVHPKLKGMLVRKLIAQAPVLNRK